MLEVRQALLGHKGRKSDQRQYNMPKVEMLGKENKILQGCILYCFPDGAILEKLDRLDRPIE